MLAYEVAGDLVDEYMHMRETTCLGSMYMLMGAQSNMRLFHPKIFGFDTLFFGMDGSHNNINVLELSLAFSRLAEGNASEVHYENNGHAYNKRYFLSEGIYPWLSTFVKKNYEPSKEKYRRFTKEHEICKKNVERHLVGIVRNPATT
jgi:hypothetical protein